MKRSFNVESEKLGGLGTKTSAHCVNRLPGVCLCWHFVTSICLAQREGLHFICGLVYITDYVFAQLDQATTINTYVRFIEDHEILQRQFAKIIFLLNRIKCNVYANRCNQIRSLRLYNIEVYAYSCNTETDCDWAKVELVDKNMYNFLYIVDSTQYYVHSR